MVYELLNTRIDQERVYAFVRDNEHLLPDPLSHHINIFDYCQKLLGLGHVIVYEEAHAILGVCMGYINDSQTLIAHLQVLIVQSSMQHNGIGRELVRSFITESEKAGMKMIRLTCDLENRKALSFYEALGFVHSSIIHPNPNKLFLDYEFD